MSETITTQFHLSEAERSHSDIHRLLSGVLNPDNNVDRFLYIREVYDDYLIYEDGGKVYRRNYTIDAEDSVTLGDALQVREITTYEPVSEAVPPGSALLESLDDDGWNWRVQIIQAGTSANGNYYPLPVLHEAAPVYRGVPVFYGRGRDHNPEERGFDSVAGWITESAPNPSGIEGVLEISPGKPDVRDHIRHAWDVKQRTGRDSFGFSHVIPHGGARLTRRRPRGWTVEAITKAESVDIVMTPAAGGALLAPLAEATEYVPDALKEALMDVERLLGRLRAGEKLSDDERKALVEAVGFDRYEEALSEGKKPKGDPAPNALVETVRKQAGKEPEPDQITESIEAKLAELEQKALLAEARVTLSEALAGSKLPDRMKAAIREDFDGRIFEAGDLEKRIQRDTEIHEALTPKGVRPVAGGDVDVTEDQAEKWQKAMDGLIAGKAVDGVKPFLTLKEAFLAITGKPYSYIDGDLARAVLAEAISYAGEDKLLQESLTTSTFAQVLGDSITRRMLREYQMPDRQSWREIASIVPVTDFRTQRRVRWGGYGLLDVVGEGAAYQDMDDLTDEEATDSLDKYGGLASLTLEMIANDDMSVVRRIPVKLGQSAIDTIYNAVWNTTIKDNATASYDATALYHVNHSNTGTTALSEAGLEAVETAMRDQTEFGNNSGLPLGAANMPRILAIPNELRVEAHKLVMSPNAVTANEDATTSNMFQGQYRVLVIDDWTDANDWYAFADPDRIPTLEIGFWQGREQPELFVQDAQTVGSVFNADKVTYKIRHVWYVMIVEHRSTYRMVVT